MCQLKIWIQIKVKVEQRLRWVVLHRSIWIGRSTPRRLWRRRWCYGDDNDAHDQWNMNPGNTGKHLRLPTEWVSPNGPRGSSELRCPRRIFSSFGKGGKKSGGAG